MVHPVITAMIGAAAGALVGFIVGGVRGRVGWVILVLVLVGVMPHIGYFVLFLRSWSGHDWTMEHLTALLVVWQTQTGAAFALVAALIGAAAIWLQTQAQLAEAADKDRLQRYGIALGVFPELITIEATHERAANLINKEWPKGSAAGPPTEVAAYVRKARH